MKRGSASERFGWNHHVHVYFLFIAFPLALWSTLHFLHVYAKRRIPSVAVLGHAVVLLYGAVVPQATTVVPQALAVVPLLRSCTTVASDQTQLLVRL